MKYSSPFLVGILFFCSCASTKKTITDDGKITVHFLQVNDVYEIAPVANGKEGGLARIATLKKQLLQKNRNSFLVMAGDFLSPSVYNSLPYQSNAIRGRQMVDAMNAAGFNLACFGNHEFDIKENELLDRLNESEFHWVASNAFHKTKDGILPFLVDGKPIGKTYVLQVKDDDGTTAKIGIISATLPFNKAAYVAYTDALQTAQTLYLQIKDSVDAVVALTHQLIADDIRLAQAVPALAVIMGGHEHDQRFEMIGRTPITKAHANARSAYIIELIIDKKKRENYTSTNLVYLNEAIALDSATNAVVQKWMTIAEKNYDSLGFDAKNILLQSGDSLEGRETEVRSRATNLTQMIIAGMHYAAPQAQVAIMNAGSIRLDDILTMPVTQYDFIRSLPFGGGIQELDMKGSLLIKVLNQGLKNKGIGGFLQHSETVKNENGIWKLEGLEIDSTKIYRVAITDFLFTGGEANLDFLNPKNPDVVKVYPAATTNLNARFDIRLALIRYLQNKK